MASLSVLLLLFRNSPVSRSQFPAPSGRYAQLGACFGTLVGIATHSLCALISHYLAMVEDVVNILGVVINPAGISRLRIGLLGQLCLLLVGYSTGVR